MLLSSVKAIREDLGFDDMTDINIAITEGLKAAGVRLSSLLQTGFGRDTVTDTFWVHEPTFQQGGHVQTEFLLSRGFVSDTPVVKLTTNPTLFDNASSVTEITGLKVEADKGKVVDWVTRYSSNYVAISYTCGFEADAEGNYNLGQVPDWLQQSAKLLCLLNIADHPALTNASIELDVSALREEYAATINQRIRYAPAALLPM